MQLTFSRRGILDLIAFQVQHGHKLTAPYTGEPIAPSLALVGDSGVYLMNYSETPNPVVDGESRQVVVYANEANPETMDFDSVWHAKRDSFGSDDGVELIAISDLQTILAMTEAHDVISIFVSPEAIELRVEGGH
jgi:Protein of unknown function (DUF3085).